MKNRYLRIIFTNHALNRLHNRRIAQSDAWYTFQNPDGSLSGKTPGSRKFYKSYGQQKIEVVAKKNEKDEWLILSCWSKYLGNNQPIFSTKESFLEKLVGRFLTKLFPHHSVSGNVNQNSRPKQS